MYKKHLWVNYGRRGTIIEIIIRDDSGGKIEMFKSNNQKDYSKALRNIKEKYGFNFEPVIKPEDSVNALEEKRKDIVKEKDFLSVDEDFKW
jgi:hypothetical protein